MKRLAFLLVMLLLTGMLAAGCTTKYIEDTKIEDSDESREVIKTVEMYRKAMESRDADMLIALASPNYFERNGDSNSSNNYDYQGLIRFLRSPEFRRITAVRMKIVYKDLDFSDDRRVATVRYHYQAEFKIPPADYMAEDDDLESSEDSMAQSAGDDPESQDNFDKEIWHSKSDENEMILELENDKWYIIKGM